MLEREFNNKKIDSAGRITLPKNLRIKYDFNEGEEVEFFTLKKSGLTYLCITLSKDLEARLEEEDINVLLDFTVEEIEAAKAASAKKKGTK